MKTPILATMAAMGVSSLIRNGVLVPSAKGAAKRAVPQHIQDELIAEAEAKRERKRQKRLAEARGE